MSNIPLARSIITEAIRSLPAGHPARVSIEAVLPLMSRKRPVKRSRVRSRNMTLRRACDVWRYFNANPEASHHEMAEVFQANIGRISEVLNGERHPEAKLLANLEIKS